MKLEYIIAIPTAIGTIDVAKSAENQDIFSLLRLMSRIKQHLIS
jgi:hypothetical protein